MNKDEKRLMWCVIAIPVVLTITMAFNYAIPHMVNYLDKFKYFQEISYYSLYPMLVGVIYLGIKIHEDQNKIIEEGGHAQWSHGLALAGLFYMALFIFAFIMNGLVLLT